MVISKEFYVVIEKDEDGLYIGEVPQLKACYSQGATIDELMENMKEVIEMCLEEIENNDNLVSMNEFIGVQKIRL
jgi:predicted RNase H-like HicB family nuclease